MPRPSHDASEPMSSEPASALKREAVVFAALAAFGILVLPFAVYGLGLRVFGEYGPDADALSLAIDLWATLGRGEWAAWLLVGSPYLVIQALRLARRLWRVRKPVTRVTDPESDTRNWRL